jgi:DNA-binding SARP family transcriptional activator
MREANLEIGLLGPLEVRLGGRRRDLPASKRTRALLGFLVTSGQTHSREALCDLLWETPDDPRQALRWSLAKLRPLLDGKQERLIADREGVRFEPAGASVDLQTARAAAAKGDRANLDELREVVALFRGEFLEGLDLSDCYRFHEWWQAQREGTRLLHESLLSRLCMRLRGKPEEALAFARARVALDPLGEEGQATVIEILTELGRKAEASKQYDNYRKILEEGAGRRPSPRIERARLSIGAEPTTDASDSTPLPFLAAPVVARPSIPLVGRQTEREAVLDWMTSQRKDASGSLLFFQGDPGIGKSRLLEEAATALRARGSTVLLGRSFEAERARPYGVWLEALGGVRDPAMRRRLPEALSPDSSEQRTTRPAMTNREGLFEGVARFLAELAGRSPVAVLLDDVHWIDEASAALLHYVSRTLPSGKALFACAARLSELQENGPGRDLVQALNAEGRLRRIELGPMSAEETASLARSVDVKADADRIFAQSEGNPLLALELARGLSGADQSSEGTARFDSLIRSRVERLTGAARDLLPWAAALGRRFEVDHLSRAGSLPATSLASALEELERHGLLRVGAGTGGYDFAHDLIRRAAYAQISAPRRRLIHRQIAHALLRESDPDDLLALELTRHAALGGEPEVAVHAALRAAERSLRLFANHEAIALADEGLAQVAFLDGPTHYRLKIALLHLKTFALAPAGSIPGSRNLWRELVPKLQTELSEAVREAQRAGLETEVARGFGALSAISHLAGDREGTEQAALSSAEASSGADPQTAARNYAFSARCLVQVEGDLRQARTLSAESYRLEREAAHRIPEVHLALGLVHYWDGEFTVSQRELASALELARGEEDRWRQQSCLAWLTLLDLESGNYRGALDRAPELESVAQKLGEGSEHPFAVALRAVALLGLEAPEADAEIGRQSEVLRTLDSVGQLSYVLVQAAEIDARAGRADMARTRAEDALAYARQVKRRNEEMAARALLAELSWKAGRRSEARSYIEPALAAATGTDLLRARVRSAVQRVARLVRAPTARSNSNGAANDGVHAKDVKWGPNRKESK